MSAQPPLLFALQGSESFGRDLAAAMGVTLAPHEERTFEDGEHKCRPLTGVRGRDTCVVHALHAAAGESVNDRLCRLLFFIAALKDHGATTVTAAVPYLAYARKDRRTKAHDPVTQRYLAQLFEAVGCDEVIALEPHNPAAFDNAFRCRSRRLDADRPLGEAVLRHAGQRALTVISPDPGGVKRAERFRETLAELAATAVDYAFVHKRRSEGVISGTRLVGDVRGRTVIVIDDLIASGTTVLNAVRACHEGGAAAVLVVATHGCFAEGAQRLFTDAGPDRLLISDSVAPRLAEHWGDRIERVGVAAVFAAALRRPEPR